MTLFVGIHIFICAFLVFVILLQPGKADGGIAFGGSSSQSIFGSKGAGNFLTKTTSVCAVLFLITSFILTRSRIMEYNRSVIGKEQPVTGSPVSPTAPKLPSTGPAKEGTPATQTEPATPQKK